MKKLSLLFLGLTIALLSCKKKNNSDPEPVLPSVITNAVSGISTNSAICGGEITSDGNANILEKGVVWSTSPNPDYNSSPINYAGSGTSAFSSNATNLIGGTTYYIRAWARNQAGTGYGNEIVFTTTGYTSASVAIGTHSFVTHNSAVCIATVLASGNSSVVVRGFCYSSTNNLPTLADLSISNGDGLGAFTSTLTGLQTNTTYYVRPYATNSSGTSYGTPIAFSTVAGIGESFQGGVMAYILQPGDAGFDPTNTHGIIAAPSDQSASAPWALTLTNTGATTQALGAGQNNTNLIVGNQGAGTYAAQLCDNLTLGGYSDWYLPSMYELEKLFLNKTLIGGFAVAFYWSSSEDTQNTAWLQSFNSNSQSPGIKTNNNYVRAVRSF